MKTFLISRRRFSKSVVVGAILGASCHAASGDLVRYAIERKPKKRVRATLSYTVHCPNMVASQWSVFAAIAPNFPGQDTTRTQMTPQPTEQRDKSPENREIIGLVTPATLTTLPVTITYEATLYSRILKTLGPDESAPPIVPLRPQDQKNYLASRGDIDHTSAAFTAWLAKNKLKRDKGESDLDFARRAYLFLKNQFEYDYKPLASRITTFVIKAGKTDCGGLSILFTATMRANNIPARVLYGRWAVSAKPNSKLGGTPYYQWHVKCECFIQEVGWLPVDLSGAVEFDKKAPQSLAYFGNDPGTFLTFHFDPNLTIDSGLYGLKPVHNLQYPMWWWTGKGSADQKRILEDWQVVELPLEPAAKSREKGSP